MRNVITALFILTILGTAACIHKDGDIGPCVCVGYDTGCGKC